ncbi:hypothetical protein N7519_001871 [Penicillium mononematosum]|uniref:uncharacterized protein n=1 Tax=Penicillium mononematosum TaxID=268346 RepID=UPI002548F54B|nr:uncharacterized protein N7519_001871 [Penicillium mononematosum]KAJ6186963.1 hypothetical protein N7519_001871 [Penicillium mononematosum]
MSRHNSVDLDSPDRPFDNIINFRDVGRSVNQFCRKEILKEGVFFRSARLDDASERDKRRLAEELHIHTVIDLRSQTEHQMGTRKRRGEIAKSESESESESNPTEKSPDPIPSNPDEHLLHIPGSNRALISLTGKGFERALLSKLDWFTYLKTIGLVTTGYRSDAVRLSLRLGNATARPDGSSARHARFQHGGDPRWEGPDGIGCFAYVVACWGVPTEAIVDDYGRSELELVSEFEERMEEIRAIGLGEDYTRCPPGFVDETTTYLEMRYGGVRGYLERVGVGFEMQERIRGKFLV